LLLAAAVARMAVAVLVGFEALLQQLVAVVRLKHHLLFYLQLLTQSQLAQAAQQVQHILAETLAETVARHQLLVATSQQFLLLAVVVAVCLALTITMAKTVVVVVRQVL
jgi:hypothetical protein